ncbi:hypothetical protein GJR96_08550 [Haloferax sp. MBLA0076]|uniref:Uncharacterized protein n=1 Tax=Haloferax litoreum TaxID=2666140 RepID=A0A6A8GF27_9EURY|nr:hypothetical protein [Haloferax litoreum]MRX22004.1 hypothetical protein [Haloferax litoreum]
MCHEVAQPVVERRTVAVGHGGEVTDPGVGSDEARRFRGSRSENSRELEM